MKPTSIPRFFGILVALMLVLPVSGLAGKGHKVKTTIDLAAGQPLTLGVEGDLAACAKHHCIVNIMTGSGHKVVRRLKVESDGSWVAYEEPEDEKGDDDDSAEGDDDDSADWREKPILTHAERIEKRTERGLEPYTVETFRGALVAGAEGAERAGPTIVLPADLLPEGSFDLGTNGYFGLNLGGVKVGTGFRTGVVRVKR